MFDFINEIEEIKNITKGYRYQNFGGEILVVQGYKDILLLEDENVVLKLKTGELQVMGKNLSVTEFSTNSIVIKGKIDSVESVGA